MGNEIRIGRKRNTRAETEHCYITTNDICGHWVFGCTSWVCDYICAPLA